MEGCSIRVYSHVQRGAASVEQRRHARGVACRQRHGRWCTRASRHGMQRSSSSRQARRQPHACSGTEILFFLQISGLDLLGSAPS